MQRARDQPDATAPPPFTGWRYRDVWWAGVRNTLGYAVSERLTRPVTNAVAGFRREWNLPPLRSPDDSFSKLAQICQMPREFDFPRAELPETFHYTGPLRRPSQVQAPFPWDRLDGRPLVYASLGTLQGKRRPVFQCFAEACKDLGVQLVINHVGALTREEEIGFPGDPLVVPYAPQFELLGRARLTITHAGLNTVLDSLANGVPMVAMPITYDQPAIARRLERTGSGRSISLARLDSGRLRKVVQRVLEDRSFRIAAGAMATAIQRAKGVARAANIVEHAVANDR
jgi:MGT family glycosyltransferase